MSKLISECIELLSECDELVSELLSEWPNISK